MGTEVMKRCSTCKHNINVLPFEPCNAPALCIDYSKWEPSHTATDPKTTVGSIKPPMHALPPVALIYGGLVMEDGERKYSLMNYRNSVVPALTYYDAALRHLFAWLDGEDCAADSGLPHLAHVIGCMAVLLDSKEQGTLKDNRPTKGQAAKLLARLADERKAKQEGKQ